MTAQPARAPPVSPPRQRDPHASAGDRHDDHRRERGRVPVSAHARPAGAATLYLRHALVPARYFRPAWAWETGLSPTDLTPFVTNTFMHGGFLHIILNLWTLYIFGPRWKTAWGRCASSRSIWPRGVDREPRARAPQCRLALSVAGCLGCHCRRDRRLRRALSLCLGARAVHHRHHPAVLQCPGAGVRGSVVLHAGRAGRQRTVQSLRRQRHRLVGAHRRLPRRHRHAAPARAARAPPLPCSTTAAPGR